MKNFCFAVLSVLLAAAQAFGQSPVTNSVREYRRANERLLLEEFIQMLSIPNVASDTENIGRNADYLVERMKRQGLNPQLLSSVESGAPPAVYGEWNTPGAKRTVVFYAHYDGQPTDPRAWTGSLPWTPVLRSAALEKGGQNLPFPKDGEKINPEWRLYARSASDDKAGVFAILQAFEALKTKNIK